ncbi:unnamed protein product, partial [Hapterophycus canaliculatus]
LRRWVAHRFPAGIREIDPDAVVAGRDVLPYSVLPGTAGFLRLMETGHLRIGVGFQHYLTGYLVVKPIDTLPLGRGLGQLPTVAIAKDVEIDFTSGNLHLYTFFDAETGICIHGAQCDV